MVEKRSTVNIVTLGCSKNKVDSEVLGAQLHAMGFEVVHDSEKKSNFVVINTCGFIGDAKEESVDTILSYASLRKRGKIARLVVMGCLSERYKKDLEREIHEVDAFYGVNDQSLIPALFKLDAPRPEPSNSCQSVRILSTPSHYAYLKISEGCRPQLCFLCNPRNQRQTYFPDDRKSCERSCGTRKRRSKGNYLDCAGAYLLWD